MPFYQEITIPRNMKGTFESTLSILKKLKTTFPSVILHPDGIEIENSTSIRLSNFPRNIHSLSMSLHLSFLWLMGICFSKAKAYDFYFKAYRGFNNYGSHYKFAAEGLMTWKTNYSGCGISVDHSHGIYEAITQLYQGEDSIGLKYSA